MAPPNTPYYEREVALVKMRTENFAFHTEALQVYPYITETYTEKAKCDLTEVEIFPPENCYVVVPRASPYKEAIAIVYVPQPKCPKILTLPSSKYVHKNSLRIVLAHVEL
jgi:hypothetical protein